MKSLSFVVLLISAFAASVFAQNGEVRGRVFWRGMVDDKIQLSIRVDKIETKTISGQAYPDGVYSFTSPLPDEPVKVDFIKKNGRGTVRIVQQPASDNEFTAIVEIFDSKGGPKEYQLEIFWR